MQGVLNSDDLGVVPVNAPTALQCHPDGRGLVLHRTGDVGVPQAVAGDGVGVHSFQVQVLGHLLGDHVEQSHADAVSVAGGGDAVEHQTLILGDMQDKGF